MILELVGIFIDKKLLPEAYTFLDYQTVDDK